MMGVKVIEEELCHGEGKFHPPADFCCIVVNVHVSEKMHQLNKEIMSHFSLKYGYVGSSESKCRQFSIL